MEDGSGDSELVVTSGIEGCMEAGGSNPENDKTDVVQMMKVDFSPMVQDSQADSG